MLHNATLNLYQVYPRACGGTTIFIGNTETVGSLSPRVRGNPFSLASTRSPMGSIPARAGEPALQRANQRPEWVYPRACGGTI